jgi:hypothetical protein
MERYDLRKRSDNPMGPRLFIQNFNFNGSELSFRFKEVMIPPALAEGVISENYWEHPENKEEAFKIDVYEMNSFEAATQLMQAILKEHMIPVLPEWDDSNSKPGEIAYGSVTHIVFSRANLVIVMNSIGNKDTDVSPYAIELDRLFTFIPDLPTREDGALLQSLQMDRGDKGTILINTGDNRSFTNRGVWFKFVTERGTLHKFNSGQLTVSEETAQAGIMVFAFIGNNPLEKRRIQM